MDSKNQIQNREIKFRAFLKELNKMETGLFGLRSDGQVSFNTDAILMQFTGLLDKNGKEICSDDLLKDEQGVIFRIYHVAGGFVMKANYWKSNCKELNVSDELIYCPLSDAQNKSWLKHSCEIIGNIYENPNLIN